MAPNGQPKISFREKTFTSSLWGEGEGLPANEGASREWSKLARYRFV